MTHERIWNLIQYGLLLLLLPNQYPCPFLFLSYNFTPFFNAHFTKTVASFKVSAEMVINSRMCTTSIYCIQKLLVQPHILWHSYGIYLQLWNCRLQTWKELPDPFSFFSIIGSYSYSLLLFLTAAAVGIF